jgi:hypothetical protein
VDKIEHLSLDYAKVWRMAQGKTSRRVIVDPPARPSSYSSPGSGRCLFRIRIANPSRRRPAAVAQWGDAKLIACS